MQPKSKQKQPASTMSLLERLKSAFPGPEAEAEAEETPEEATSNPEYTLKGYSKAKAKQFVKGFRDQ